MYFHLPTIPAPVVSTTWYLKGLEMVYIASLNEMILQDFSTLSIDGSLSLETTINRWKDLESIHEHRHITRFSRRAVHYMLLVRCSINLFQGLEIIF
jgi:hypothetical protein